MAFDPTDSFVEYTIRVDTSEAEDGFNKLNTLVRQYFALARRGGLPENIRMMVIELEKAAIMAQAAERNVRAFQLAWATGGLGTWMLALGGAALTGLMMGDYFYDAGRGR